MGTKLQVDLSDPFFDLVKPRPRGICGGCYCCGQQIHLEFQYLGVLPTAKVDGTPYQIIICDLCEEDVTNLEKEGLENISYDILFQIQEALRDRMYEFDDAKGDVSEKDRFNLLKQLYIEFDDRSSKLKE